MFFLLTQGNVSDVSVLEELASGLTGKLYGDKGYISFEVMKKLLDKGLQLFTTLRTNMKNKLLALQDRIFLRKRAHSALGYSSPEEYEIQFKKLAVQNV